MANCGYYDWRSECAGEAESTIIYCDEHGEQRRFYCTRHLQRVKKNLLKTCFTVLPGIQIKPNNEIKSRVGALTPGKKLRILKRDRYRCTVCRFSNNLHIDHILERSRGGKHEDSNLRTLCADCHKKRHRC